MHLEDFVEKTKDFGETFPREKLREIYKCENGDAFEKFYSGVVKIHNNDVAGGIADLKESLKIEGGNPFPYHFMYMASLFSDEVSDEEIFDMVNEWVRVAEKSGIQRQISFSRAARAHENHRRMKDFSVVV